MTKVLLRSLATVTALGLAAPSIAQDWLGIHLDTQREENLRRHQQQQPAESESSQSSRYDPPISGRARHAAMRRHHSEYGRIMKERGVYAADQWLADQVAAGR